MQPVLEKFQKKADAIAALSPQRIRVERYFECYNLLLARNPSWEAAVSWLGERREISRDNLKQLATSCQIGSNRWSTLFVVTMLWGYGENDDSGPVKLFFALVKTPNAERVIDATANYVNDGDLANAFIKIRDLRMIGTSYGTKFLFAVGLGSQVDPKPLVLDNKLTKALCNWWGKEVADKQFDLLVKDRSNPKGLQRAAKGYMAYCSEIQVIANKLNPPCPPEQLEQFLFENPVNETDH